MNHIMFGEINAWYYKGLGGIFPDEEKPGFKNIIIRPNIVEKLDQFEASHESPYGTIVSSWKRIRGKVIYDLTIPPNSTATLYLKGSKISEQRNLLKWIQQKGIFKVDLTAGIYRFTIKQ